MNLPTLPTDNLYKFLSLSGLGVLILSVVFPSIQINELELQEIRVSTDLAVLREEVDALKRAVDSVDIRVLSQHAKS